MVIKRRGVIPVYTSAPVVPPSQPVTSKLVLGWDFSGNESTVTVTGAGVSNVTDSSGNGNAGTQTVDARRMTYGVLTVNSKLVASTAADVVKHVIVPATITGWAANGQPPFHMLCLFQAATWTNAREVFLFKTAGAAPRFGLRLSTSGGTRVEARVPTAVPGSNTILSSQTALAVDTTYLAELSVDSGGTASLIVNEGTAATSTSASSGEALSVRRLGDLTAAADMKVGGAYLFNDALTAPELALWRTFLKARWGYV